LTRKGAGFDAKQEEFINDIRPTDLDVDTNAHLFVADWGRRDWGNVGAVGSVYRVEPTTRPNRPEDGPAPLKTQAPPGGAGPSAGRSNPSTRPLESSFPDLAAATQDELLADLTSASAILRLNAQQELIRRGSNPKLSATLTQMAMKRGELDVRVAALFTLKQL